MEFSVRNSAPSFTGMSPDNIRRFIPNLEPDMVKELSAELERSLPNDVLQVITKDGTEITRCIKFGGFAVPYSGYTYTGGNGILEKISYLRAIVHDINKIN